MLGMMSASRQSAAAWRDLGDRYALHGETSKAAEAYDRALREAGFRPTVPLRSWETWSLA
jgi:cytochrome c-type biogenesis protein CcmH/NrfG